MFAVHFNHFGLPDVLTMGDLSGPHAREGTVRIRVKTARVAPVDLSLRSGTSSSSETLALPHIPGVDASGYVDEIGSGVSGVSVGDEVFGSVEKGFLFKGYPFRGPSRQGLFSGVRARVGGWLCGPVRPESGVCLVTSPWAISR